MAFTSSARFSKLSHTLHQLSCPLIYINKLLPVNVTSTTTNCDFWAVQNPTLGVHLHPFHAPGNKFLILHLILSYATKTMYIEQLPYWSKFFVAAAWILLGGSVTTIMAWWWRKCLIRPAASAPTAAWAVSGIFPATGLQFYIANWVILTLHHKFS